MPDDVRRAQIRVSVGGRRPREETHRVQRPKYVDYLLEWVERQVDDAEAFPQGNAPFPENFQGVVRKIFTRLFRVYAHIYHSHFQQICALGAEAHLNTLFKHFVYFTGAFSLVKREELAPLGELVDGILGVVPSRGGDGAMGAVGRASVGQPDGP